METLNLKSANDIITMYILSDEEMISIRGGEGETGSDHPYDPPVKI
jgi:hypothetical protein